LQHARCGALEHSPLLRLWAPLTSCPCRASHAPPPFFPPVPSIPPPAANLLAARLPRQHARADAISNLMRRSITVLKQPPPYYLSSSRYASPSLSTFRSSWTPRACRRFTHAALPRLDVCAATLLRPLRRGAGLLHLPTARVYTGPHATAHPFYLCGRRATHPHALAFGLCNAWRTHR